MDSPFSPEQNQIFETKEPFDDAWTPTEILERDDAIDDYAKALQDVLDGFGPPNIFVYGESGLGKTALTEKMMEFLRNDTENTDTDLTIININCNKRNSTYHVIRHLANELSSETWTQGHHHSKLWSVIYDELDNTGGDFLIILDEIDHLGQDDTLLYEFPRARSMNEIENARVGVIGICNNFLYRDNLRDRVKNTLCETEIRFSPYDASELRTILGYYADITFKPDVLSSDVVPLAAAITAQETGDARSGLDLLEQAGDIARDEGVTIVTDSHVQQARVEVERANVVEIFLEDLTVQQQILFLAIMALDVTVTDSDVKFQQVYNQYRQYCDDLDSDQMTKRRVRDFVGILEQKGLVESDMHNIGGRGGRWKSYAIAVSPNNIIDAIDEADTRFGLLMTNHVRNAIQEFEGENLQMNPSNY
jgi:cell division control protein 6